MSTAFSEISARYERDSLIQKSAAEKLFSLLDIQSDDHVLDLGCGTGSLTRKIRELTNGRVVGVDPNHGMISEAVRLAEEGVQHAVAGAEEISFAEEFDVIFCNSAFQWFPDPPTALGNCYRALRHGGRIGIQAPAREVYCPNFVTAVNAVASDQRTREIFNGFRPPWFFLETDQQYRELFVGAGFKVAFATIEEQETLHPPEEVMTIFESGAAAGYLNQSFYSTPVTSPYAETFRRIVLDSFRQQATDSGQVRLVFYRIYLLAVK